MPQVQGHSVGLSTLLVAAGIVCFILAIFGVPLTTLQMIAAGLAFWAAADLAA